MTDRELDAEVAEKVFSWKRNNGIWETCGVWELLPLYSSSLRDAWLIVDKMQGEVKIVKIHKHRYKYYCRIQKPTDIPDIIRPLPEFGEAKADSAPKAICLAALKAIEVKV